MKTLIAYASRHGQTQKIAAALRQQLQEVGIACQLLTCQELLVRREDLPLTTAVILGSPVYYGAYDRKFQAVVTRHRDHLNSVPTAFFSVCFGTGSSNQTERTTADEISAQFVQRTGWQPQLTHVFAGAIRYSQYGWFKKRLVYWMAKRAGLKTDLDRDLELTDWAQVQAFGNQFIDGLMGKPIASKI